MMGQPFRFGRFTVDPVQRVLRDGDVPVPLGGTDFRLLLALVERAGVTVAKDDLVKVVWARSPVSDNALYVHINALRKALGDDCIVTKQGRGYRFVAPLRGNELSLGPEGCRSRSGNLPALWIDSAATGPSRLIGRSDQLRLLSDLLRQRRLVTLTGPGGVGKTRLVIQVANEAATQFPDGVWLVELASLNDADFVPGAVASTLGVRIGANVTALDALSRHIAGK